MPRSFHSDQYVFHIIRNYESRQNAAKGLPTRDTADIFIEFRHSDQFHSNEELIDAICIPSEVVHGSIVSKIDGLWISGERAITKFMILYLEGIISISKETTAEIDACLHSAFIKLLASALGRTEERYLN